MPGSRSRALPSDGGHLLETIETSAGTFHAVLFRGLDGDEIEIDSLDGDHFRAWGAALGALHAAMRRYPNAGEAVRPSWSDQLNEMRVNLATAPRSVITELDHVNHVLESLPMHTGNFGLIHGDFELDNLVWSGRSIQILDFGDAPYSWYVADIVYALRDLFGHEVDEDNPSFRAFLDGYATHHSLDQQSLAWMPVFLRLSELVTYARIARGLDLGAGGAYPEWLRGLERRLRERMVGYEHSLASRGR